MNKELKKKKCELQFQTFNLYKISRSVIITSYKICLNYQTKRYLQQFQLQFQYMNFWDIDSFLAEEQTLKYQFKKDALGMQFLDPTKGYDGFIGAQQPITSPIWVVNIINEFLLGNQGDQDLFRVNFPKHLQSKNFRNRVKSFQAQQGSSLQRVNFQVQSPYFYELYLLLQKLMMEQSATFDQSSVGNDLQIRGKLILIRASNYIGLQKIDQALNTYTVFEMKLYEQTKSTLKQYDAWKYSHKWLHKYNSLQKN